AKLTKPVLNQNIDYLKDGLNKNLPETKYTKSQWQSGWIPQACKNLASDTKTSPKDFEIWDVTYADCGDPWVFCHHKNSGITIDSMARQFGKVPIQMRQWVRHILDVPAEGGWAFETDGNIVFNKPDDDMLPVIIHETGHSVDLSGAYDGKPISSSDDFWNNYDKDPNVSDNYAASNMVENVAQNTVIAVYNENVPGQYAGIEPKWNNIFHQYATLISRAIANGKGNNYFKPGQDAQCTHRMPPSAKVSVDGKKRSVEERRAGPKVGLSDNVIPIITQRDGVNKHSNCSVSW
ncbi:hypothetical protein P280DRAFT_405066, partial [Massarina eburnea CBS 473.64]